MHQHFTADAKPAVRMKIIRVALYLLVVAAAGFGVVAMTAQQPVQAADVAGDYWFDEKDKRAVFMTHVYEDGGKLYAQLDIIDHPLEMESKDPEHHQYTATSHRGKRFLLTFSQPGDGWFTRLNLRMGSNDLDITGTRFEGDPTRLRDFHLQTNGEYSYRMPPQLNDGWEVLDLRETGIDNSLLDEMMRDIRANSDFMQSVLIVKGGKLVFEEYMNGWDPPRLHRLQSVTKSVTSTVVGIAIEEGLIGDVHDPLHEYLLEYASLFNDPKKKIQIEHLLTMTAGFEWNELETYYAKPEDCDSNAAEASGDYIRYVLEKHLVHDPGSVWYYNSGYPNILGYVIEGKAGTNLLEFSYRHLFDPLGIERAYWHTITGEERPSCAGGLWLTSRDMAKFGELYLRGGVWGGKRILPAAWVETSTRFHVDTSLDVGYGYFWKRLTIGDLDLIFASGTGGQFIVCIPAFDAVVVTTAQFNTNKSDAVVDLLIKYVVPALASAS